MPRSVFHWNRMCQGKSWSSFNISDHEWACILQKLILHLGQVSPLSCSDNATVLWEAATLDVLNIHVWAPLFKSRFKTSQTVGRWCWWLESSRCISFLAGRDGDESAHSSSPAWDPISCYVGSAHLFKYHGRSRGTLWDPEWLLIGSNSSRKPPTLHPVLIDPWESRK